MGRLGWVSLWRGGREGWVGGAVESNFGELRADF